MADSNPSTAKVVYPIKVDLLLSELRNKIKVTIDNLKSEVDENSKNHETVDEKTEDKKYLYAAEIAVKLTCIAKITTLHNLYNIALENKDIELLVSVCAKLGIQIPMDSVCEIFENFLYNGTDGLEAELALKPLKPQEKYYVLYTALKKERDKKKDERKNLIAILIYNMYNDIELLSKNNSKQGDDNPKDKSGVKPDNQNRGRNYDNRRG